MLFSVGQTTACDKHLAVLNYEALLNAETTQNYAPTDDEFVKGLYCALLDRYPDPDGFESHIRALKHGTPRSEMRETVLRSREYAVRNGLDRDTSSFVASKFIEQLRVIGDSHSQTLNGLLVTWSDGTPYGFGSSRFVPGLDASKCFDFDNGSVNKRVAYALHDFGIIKRVDERTDGVLWDGDAAYEPIRVGPPRPVLFMIGELDARALLAAIPSDADIDAGLFGHGVVRRSSTGPTVPAHAIRSAFMERFRPMFRMLTELTKLGVKTYVASITPPTDDDELYQRSTGILSTNAAVRFDVYRAASSLLGEACASIDVGFIDVWDKVTEAGCASKDILFDGVHYNASGASQLICAYANEVAP